MRRKAGGHTVAASKLVALSNRKEHFSVSFFSLPGFARVFVSSSLSLARS